MAITSSPKYSDYERTASHAVSPYITLSILVAGVVGGLVIVIAFILFCKYCVKKQNTIRRDQGTDCERSSDRRFKPFQRYETINSDMFSEPSTGSMDGIPISPRRFLETKSLEKIPGIDEANETTRLKSDFEKTSFCETNLDLEPYVDEEYREVEEAKETDTRKEASEDTEVTGRRVSFQLDNLPPTPSGYLRKGRRYTEGDFHYLKKIRIAKNSVPRQYSLGSTLQRERYTTEDTYLDLHEEEKFHQNDVCVKSVSSGVEDYSVAHALVRPYMLDSPTSANGAVGPQLVDVEIHHRGITPTKEVTHYGNRKHSYSRSPCMSDRGKILKPISHSMDTVSPSNTPSHKHKRRVKSYDDVLDYDYDILKITEFSRGPYFNNDFDPIMEVEGLATSKVRYNDMGSLEVLNDDKIDIFDEYEYENIIPDESDADTETTINGTQKFRELWNLRATFEEEEECSDTIRMEDMASPEEQSSDQGGASYSPTYHIQHAAQYHNGFSCKGATTDNLNNYVDPQHVDPEDSNLLHPNYENRRDNFRTVVGRRYQKRGSTSAENSFDSVETDHTDGDATESSRHEATTSFESTTDNTDSTGDSQTSRLRQMKADSGYKSLETQHPPCANGTKKAYSMDDEIILLGSEISSPSPEKPIAPKHEILEAVGTNESVPRRHSLFEKRRGRTASKRRREYSRERHVVRLNETAYEQETDSARSDQPSGDSLDEPNTPSTKVSVFSRFFKSHKSRDKGLSRDFSIDEKTNTIFQEFVRFDPKLEVHRGSVSGIESRRHRLQRKFTDPGVYTFDDTRRFLSPEMRSTSLGSDSSASSARRLSPQDSIEEEEFEDDIDAAVMDHKNKMMEEQSLKSVEVTTPTVSVHEIPIIKLPEGETVDA
ncbi:uncharacterized protein LOC123525179 [Mercenaria mercenaria]|uniref:uncharacterized protein LOC123525179 n=1 Tax=Mercenaria mercenaria TaxID=6596 RepID=UPI00234ED301|nr:uncharacterized protein LOC123525179 [Mercenaria mercenaria]